MPDRHFIALLALTLLVATNAAAQEATAETRHPATFNSINDAVLGASRHYNPQSIREDREFMGAIFQQNINGESRFGYTIGSGDPHRDRITVRFRLPQGSKMVAIWHTHGSAHWSRRYFSSTDTRLAETIGLPVYLANGQGELRVFEPGERRLSHMQARRLGLGDQAGSAKGELLRRDLPVS